jgi:hypothetical protein
MIYSRQPTAGAVLELLPFGPLSQRARGVEGAKWRSPADTENDYPDDGLKRAAHIIRSAMPDKPTLVPVGTMALRAIVPSTVLS